MSEQSMCNGTLQSEIRYLFDRHMKILVNQKWRIVEEMGKWSRNLITQIQEYVDQQRELLEEIYQKKKFYLDALCIQSLEKVQMYEQQQQNEQINQLINKCNSLKLEFFALAYVDRPISTIQLITEEQVLVTNEDQYNLAKTEDEQSSQKTNEDYEKSNIKNNVATENEPSNLISTNSELTNTPPITKKSINNNDQLFHCDANKSYNNVSNNDELFEKCPICYMIFPQTMTIQNRNFHVNDHY